MQIVHLLWYLILMWASQMMSVSLKEVTVLVNQGILIGFEDLTERGDRFVAFRSIPYAVPPINELRFKDPVAQEQWADVVTAEQYGSPCPQWDYASSTVIGNEDCLTLNIFTPQVPLIMYETRQYPVMFWIHGGAFMIGSSSLYGPAKLMSQSIILVTVNYRLGALGFLSTNDIEAPGNYGMMDLVLALKWVQHNIQYFGGDPQRVTLFGESAGAAAVSHLIVSPLTRGLFWTAITQSGSSLCDWAVEEDPYSYTKKLATSLDCNLESSQRIMECLRHRSASEIVLAQQKQIKYGFFPLRTVPIVDQGLRSEPFLPDKPEILLSNGNFSTVPLISGVVAHEGLYFALQILLHFATDLVLNPNYFEEILLPQVLSDLTYQIYSPTKISQIKNFYFKNVDMTKMDDVIPPFVDLLSDILFFPCNDKMVKLHSRYAPVYMYLFKYRGNQTFIQHFIDKVDRSHINSPLLTSGVSHADDLLYLFNIPNVENSKWVEDQRIQDALLYLWTTFAHQGTPNRVVSNQGPITNFWNSLREADLIYLNIDTISYISRGFRQFEISIFNYINYSPAAPLEKYVTSGGSYFVATWVLVVVIVGLIIACAALAILLKRSSVKRVYSTKHLDAYN